VVLSSLLFYTGEQALEFAETKEPHTTRSFGFELRPLKRVRLIEALMTDHLHTAAAGLLIDMILSPSSVAQTTPLPLSSQLVMNYNQEQIEVLVDVTRKLMLRGGYRYVWGNAETPAALIAGAGLESSELRQNVALAGVTYRLSHNLSANLDFEGAWTSRAYFRTSLYNYQKMRAHARYRVAARLALQASFVSAGENRCHSGRCRSQPHGIRVNGRGRGKVLYIRLYSFPLQIWSVLSHNSDSANAHAPPDGLCRQPRRIVEITGRMGSISSMLFRF
jgi:hypothetical protein